MGKHRHPLAQGCVFARAKAHLTSVQNRLQGLVPLDVELHYATANQQTRTGAGAAPSLPLRASSTVQAASSRMHQTIGRSEASEGSCTLALHRLPTHAPCSPPRGESREASSGQRPTALRVAHESRPDVGAGVFEIEGRRAGRLPIRTRRRPHASH